MSDREYLMELHDRLRRNGLESDEGLLRIRRVIGMLPVLTSTMSEYSWPGMWRPTKAPFVGAIPKPPIGLRPRHIAVKARMEEIMDAITRYHEGKKDIPCGWVSEWLALSDEYARYVEKKERGHAVG